MLSDRQNSSYSKSTVIAYTNILINIGWVSKHSVTIRGLRLVNTCWSWAWSNHTCPSKWVGLGSPLAACSMYGDLTCSIHTVNNLCMFNCQCHFYLCNRGPYVRLAFMPNMLSSWNKDIITITIIILLDDGLYIYRYPFSHVPVYIYRVGYHKLLKFYRWHGELLKNIMLAWGHFNQAYRNQNFMVT